MDCMQTETRVIQVSASAPTSAPLAYVSAGTQTSRKELMAAGSSKPQEKEVNFSDVPLVAGQKPPLSTHPSKSNSTCTFPKSIMKNASSNSDTTGYAGSNTGIAPKPVTIANSSPANWDPQPTKSDDSGPAAVAGNSTTKNNPAPKQEIIRKGVIDTIGLIGMESDQESDADLSRKMSIKDVSLESDCVDGSILSPDEDEDEDDGFKVHFVHHGKKVEETMAHQSDLMFQISELQEAVVAMKASLKEAVTKLSLVEGSAGAPELEQVKMNCEGNSAEILKMVLALKTDFSALRHEVMSVSNRQDTLQKSLRIMLEDRRTLVNDLGQAGVISQHTRNRLDSLSSIIGTGGQSGSGSHSNDSGVALLLEKTHNAFTDDSGTLHLSGQRTSDQDSLPDQPSLLVPASVYDYVAGLSQQGTSQFQCQDLSSTPSNERPLHVKEGSDDRTGDPDDLRTVYDSDSSLTIAANKTISLSTCIGQEIRVNDTYAQLPSSRHHHHPQHSNSANSEGNPRLSRGESEGSDGAVKEKSSSQGRRRRPLLGVSSTKHYQSTSHGYSSGEKEHHGRHRHVIKGDPRESQRYKLAKELVDTEKQYCRTLWTIQDVFAEPLKKAAILSNRDISTLFPEEVYLLYDKHCLLQHQLKERLASWKWQPLIGDVLARFTDPHQCEVLRLYTNYVNDFPDVLKTFNKLCHTSQPFTDFIKSSLEQPACRGLDLGAFLLTPVQRVPKYILLLKQLLKYTDSTHPDYRLIETVLERLREFLARLNDAMEHSFRLVNSSLSPAINSSGGLTVSSVPTKYRNGRTPRKSSGSKDSPTSHSPSNTRRNRHSRQYQPSSSSPSDAYRSPKRSCSNAGNGSSSSSSPKKSDHTTGRSASLPRGFPSLSSDSPDSSADGQESSPDRSSSGTRYRTHHHHHHETPYHHNRTKYATLAPARSVSNMASLDDLTSRWDDLAASEPSLIDSTKIPISKPLSKNATHSSSLSIHHHSNTNSPTSTTVGTANTHKLVTWTDSVESTDDAKAKKKASIKSSLKNMFTFKKRPNGQRNLRDEPLYWPSSVILEASAEAAQNPIYSTAASCSSNAPGQVGTVAPTVCLGPVSSVPSNANSVSIGDFVDEDGNPCSNV